MVIIGKANPIDTDENDTIRALQDFLGGKTNSGELLKEYPKAKLDVVIDLAHDLKSGSGERQLLSNYTGYISPDGIKRVFNGYTSEYGQKTEEGTGEVLPVSDTSTKGVELPQDSMSATEKLGLGIGGGIGAIVGLRKGVSAIRKEIPNVVKRGDIKNTFVNKLMLGNYSDKPEVLNKKSNNLIKLVQNMSDEDIKNIGKKGYNELYNYVKNGLKQVQAVRQTVLDNIKGMTIEGEKILGPLKQEFTDALPSERPSIQKVYNDVVSKLDKNGNILAEDAEKLKEKFYNIYNKYDKADRMNVTEGDLRAGESYKTTAKTIKQNLENLSDIDNPGILKQSNKEYGILKDIEYSVGKESNKIGTQEVYSSTRNIGTKAKPIISKTPFIPGTALPSLSEGAKKTTKLGDTLRYIKKWGNRMLSNVESEAPQIEKTVGKSAPKTTSKVLGKTLGVLGIAGVAQQLAPDPLAGQESEGNIPAKMVSIAQNLIGKYKGKKEIPEREIVRAGFMGNEIQAIKNEFKKWQTGVKPIEIKKGTSGIKPALKQTAKTSLGF